MITKEMSILEIIQKYPEAMVIFKKYNMSCSHCMGASLESLEVGAKQHGVNVEQLLSELNSTAQ